MNLKFLPCLLASLPLILGTAGCETSGITSLKNRGVYTVLSLGEPSLDLPAIGYQPRNTFHTGETPAAVIVGYGEYNRPQLVALDVVELRTGKSIFGHDYYATYGKVVVQPLPMRISGRYQVRLIVNESVSDTCEFTVEGENSATSSSNSPTDYANSSVSVDLSFPVENEALAQTTTTNKLLTEYEKRLTYDMYLALFKEINEAKPNPFIQRPPGSTLIRCNLNASGQLTNLNVMENSLGNECSRLILQALMKRSPYSPWPENVRQLFGSDSRTLVVRIGFQ